MPDVNNLLFNPSLSDFHSEDVASVYIGVNTVTKVLVLPQQDINQQSNSEYNEGCLILNKMSFRKHIQPYLCSELCLYIYFFLLLVIVFLAASKGVRLKRCMHLTLT